MPFHYYDNLNTVIVKTNLIYFPNNILFIFSDKIVLAPFETRPVLPVFKNHELFSHETSVCKCDSIVYVLHVFESDSACELRRVYCTVVCGGCAVCVCVWVHVCMRQRTQP